MAYSTSFKRRKVGGYTLVEFIIVLAIMGFMTTALLTNFRQSTRVESFSGKLRAQADFIKETQTGSYSTKGDCPSATECYWRGLVLEYDVTQNQLNQQFLTGSDLSRFSANTNQQLGITAKLPSRSINYEDQGLVLERVYGASGLPINKASIAFLAPDGNAYTAHSIQDSFNPMVAAYNLKNPITIEFRDVVTGIVGTVTFDPGGATISTSIK